MPGDTSCPEVMRLLGWSAAYRSRGVLACVVAATVSVVAAGCSGSNASDRPSSTSIAPAESTAPETVAPETVPPETSPPATEPPVTEPPVTEPSATTLSPVATSAANIETTVTTIPAALPTTALPTTVVPSSTTPLESVPDPLVASLGLADDAGVAITEPAAQTVRALYAASTARDLEALTALAAAGPVRTNMGTENAEAAADGIVAMWSLEPDTDLIAAISALLQTTPATNSKGQIVYPGLAIQPSEEWTDQDTIDLTRLGFTPNQVAGVQKKGRYLDRRIVINADGTWYSYTIGL
jgi:hypothetical protein